MSYIEPQSDITLYVGCPLEPDYNHTAYFNSITEQNAYFDNPGNFTNVFYFTAQSYQRHAKGVLTIATPEGAVLKANYLRFRNVGFPDILGNTKWFYAFITHTEYVNNNATRIWYSIDVMQTWAFDYELGYCFIERQHAETDRPGDNTIPENLSTGTSMEYDMEELRDNLGSVVTPFESGRYSIVVFYGTELTGTSIPAVRANVFNGIDCKIFSSLSAPTDAYNFLKQLNIAGQSDSVVAVLMCPTAIISWPGTATAASSFDTATNYKQLNLSRINGVYEYNQNTDAYYRKFGNYTPVNNKLYTEPYFGMLLTSSSGATQKLGYEYFPAIEGGVSRSVFFKMFASITPNITASIVPLNYKGLETNYEEGIDCHDFPQCVWATDAFKAWYAQNSLAFEYDKTELKASTAAGIGTGALSLLKDLVGIGGKTSTITYNDNGKTGSFKDYQIGTPNYAKAGADVGSGIIGGLANWGNAYNAFNKAAALAEYLPDKSRGNAGAYMNYTRNTVGFLAYTYHIREEYAIRIDQYFHMYGYAQNKVAIPNRNVRPNWTYVKTAFVSYTKNEVPADDLEVITSLYNRGITFWNNPNNIGNYSLANKAHN